MFDHSDLAATKQQLFAVRAPLSLLKKVGFRRTLPALSSCRQVRSFYHSESSKGTEPASYGVSLSQIDSADKAPLWPDLPIVCLRLPRGEPLGECCSPQRRVAAADFDNGRRRFHSAIPPSRLRLRSSTKLLPQFQSRAASALRQSCPNQPAGPAPLSLLKIVGFRRTLPALPSSLAFIPFAKHPLFANRLLFLKCAPFVGRI